MSSNCPQNFLMGEVSNPNPNMLANSLSLGTSVTLESYLMSPNNNSFSDDNPDPNQGPYDTEKWPAGTILVRGQDRYLFGHGYAGVIAAFPTIKAARILTGGGVADSLAITFPTPLLKGQTTLNVEFTYANLAKDAFKGGHVVFTTAVPGSGPTGNYEITSNTAGTSSATIQPFTITLASPLNGNSADSTAPIMAELMWNKYKLWPARSVDAPICVSIVETTATHPYAWFMTEGRATLDCVTRTTFDAVTGLPRLWSPQLGDELYVMESGNAANSAAYDATNTGTICTVESPLVDVQLATPVLTTVAND